MSFFLKGREHDNKFHVFKYDLKATKNTSTSDQQEERIIIKIKNRNKQNSNKPLNTNKRIKMKGHFQRYHYLKIVFVARVVVHLSGIPSSVEKIEPLNNAPAIK